MRGHCNDQEAFDGFACIALKQVIAASVGIELRNLNVERIATASCDIAEAMVKERRKRLQRGFNGLTSKPNT